VKFTPSDECSIEFVPIENEAMGSRIWYWVSRYFQFFFLSLQNTYTLIRHGDLNRPLAKSRCPMRWIWEFPSLVYTAKMTSNSQMMKAILKHPRKDPEGGFFNDIITADMFVPLLKDLFGIDETSANDFLLSAHKDLVNQYRQPILQFIGLQNIKKHGGELEKIAIETVASWKQLGAEGNKINGSELSFIYTTNVISRLLLGHPGPGEEYQKIASSIQFLFYSMMKKVFYRKSLNKEEKKEYDESIAIIRKAVETSLTTEDRPQLGSLIDVLRNEKQMTDLQIKSTLFLMYLGGSETTGTLLTYLLWQLGRHPEYQEEIYREIQSKEGSLFEIANSLSTVEKLFAESIRLFTPVYVIGRFPTKDMMCVVKDKEGKTIFQERISRKGGIGNCPGLAGRDPNEFENPDTFNPHRFKTPIKSFSWHPFGDGKHSCPGQWLSKAEVAVFVTELVRQFQIESFPEKEPERKGRLSLRIEEDVWLSLRSRVSD
jgi:cytochrome P450